MKSVFWSVGAAVPALKKAGGGSIINISSIGSVRPRPGLVWYNSSKGAVTNVSLPVHESKGSKLMFICGKGNKRAGSGVRPRPDQS